MGQRKYPREKGEGGQRVNVERFVGSDIRH